MPTNTYVKNHDTFRTDGHGNSGAGGSPSAEPVCVDEPPDEVCERLTDDLIDELLAGRRTEEQVVGPGGLLADLTKRLVERAVAAELTDHLGYEPHREPGGGAGNIRNGTAPKTLKTERGDVLIQAPRDRWAPFDGSGCHRFRWRATSPHEGTGTTARPASA